MPEIIHASSFKNMPWKNGGGATKEIYRYPETGDFKLRISTAIVHQSGPFSHFPGIDRCLLLLEGEGFILNKKIPLKNLLDQWHFAGEESIQCDLIQGSCTDFNIMIDRSWGKIEARASTLPKGESWDGHADYLYLHKTQPEFIILRPEETVTLEAREDMLVVEIFIQKYY